MKRPHVLLLALCLAATAATGWAGGLPDYYPASFPRTGNIDRLAVAAATIVINDTKYQLDTSAPVHTPRTQFATLGDLSVGMQIAFNATSGTNGMPRISEIWVLPRNFHSSSRMGRR